MVLSSCAGHHKQVPKKHVYEEFFHFFNLEINT
jgi:hypothetical protein